MLGHLARLLLVSTAFAPVLFTLSFVRWVQGTFDYRAWMYIGLAVALTATCVIVLTVAKRSLQILTPFTIGSIRTADKEVLTFALSYLLPLTKLTPAAVDWRVNIFVLVLLMLIVLTTHTYHFNPLLGLLGYHFYEVSSTDGVSYVLITRKDMRRKAQITDVVQLTDYIVMEKA